jgi:antibiotic biosynthesis monooxygenase (ABM) superfamily enzyme
MFNNKENAVMSENQIEMLRISRLLSPEHRADLLAWVRLAFAAENSVRKLFGYTGSSSLYPQGDSCGSFIKGEKE